MKKLYSEFTGFRFRFFLAFNALVLFNVGLFAQINTVSSVPPLNGGNSSAGVTFNVSALNAITLEDFGVATASSTTGTYQLWYRTSAISGAPTITTAAGWTQLATGSLTGLGVGNVVALNSGISINMTSGQTFGFYISFSGNVSYSNGGTAPTVFSDANLSFNTGTGVGYGGSIPNPTFTVRQFNGSVMYSLSTPCSNPAAGGTTVASASSVCPSTPVQLTLSGATSGLGTTFQWQSSSNGTIWSNISGANGGSYSTTIASPTYFRCETACSGGTSAFSTPVLVNVSPFFTCYCSAGATSTTYGYIEQFDFANVSFTSPSGCGQSYTNNTSLVANVFQGTTYTLGAFVNNCTGTFAYNSGFKVWIDYNQNGSFADPGEEVIAQNLTYYQTHGGPITIPATSLTGTTGMRVMVVESGNLALMNPCYTYTWGEVEDYSINIIAPPADDAGIVAINSPSFPACELDSNICVTLTNGGTDTLFSCDVSYSINGGATTTYNWTGMIPPLSDDSVCTQIGVYNFAVGDDLVIYANNANGTVGSLYAGNDTVEIFDMNVSLQGTYGIPSDFATINEAVTAMNTYGVCDHVVFELASGTYTENITLGQVAGMGEDATVTFRSATGDTADVTIEFAGNITTNAVVIMNNADWFRFKNITFKTTSTSYPMVFRIEGGSSNNILDSNRLIGFGATTSTLFSVIYSNGGLDNNNTYSNNTIENGSYSFYLRGQAASAGNYELGTVITNNIIKNPYFYGIYMIYHQGAEVSGNSVSSNSMYTFGYGIFMADCDNGFNLTGNHVYADSNDVWPYYGLYTSFSEGSSQGFGYVTNNIVSLSTGFYGYYQYYTDAVYTANNTFIIRNSTSTSSRAYIAFYSDFFFTHNNICVNFGSGQAAGYVYGTAFGADNNAYYSNGANQFFYNGQFFTTFEAFQNSSTFDPNGLYADPLFSNDITGELCNEELDGAGTPLSYVTDDFAHVVRGTTPDVGAREFVALSNFSLSSDTVCGSNYQVVGPVNNAIWTVNNVTSTGLSVDLNATAATTFNVGIAFSSGCNLDSVTGLPIPVTASGVVRLIPSVALNSSLHMCADETATLNPGGAATASYVWFPTNETTPTITIDQGGVYSVSKVEEGCESEATILVTQSDGVVLLDADACADNLPYVVDATIVGGTNYLWSDGSTTATLDLSTTGVYYVTTTDVEGCLSSDSMMFEAIDVPVAAITETHSGFIYLFSSATSQNVGSNGSYTWDFGDGSPFSNDPNPTHQFPWTNPSAPAGYWVVLTITNDCGTHEVSQYITADPTGINEVGSEVSYTVYPNPSAGMINVEFVGNSGDQASMRVLDITGRVVNQMSAKTGNIKTMDLSGVASGTYILEVNIDGKVSNTRISIQ